jgi:hypothetical protein
MTQKDIINKIEDPRTWDTAKTSLRGKTS